MESATFAGGCFWCTEAAFAELPGVESVTSGYTGGHVPNPGYEQVCAGNTGHLEGVRIVFDPALVTYETLLDSFWRSIDPLDAEGQFADRGTQYRTAIFVENEAQRAVALASREAVSRALKQPIATEILPAAAFWPAEEYHQNYYCKNPLPYTRYSTGSGRKRRLEEVWGDKITLPLEEG